MSGHHSFFAERVIISSVSGAHDPLIDAHGRGLTDLRVSVTDRCNFRCRYCMPAEGMEWLDRADVLSFEEIERLVRVLVGLGIRDIRLTGGEPLARRDFPHLVGMLRAIDGIHDLAVTTNGYLLERQANALVAAGIDRVNVSSDSLARDRFHEITPPRRAAPGPARTRGDRCPRDGAADQGERRRDARLHRGRDLALL